MKTLLSIAVVLAFLIQLLGPHGLQAAEPASLAALRQQKLEVAKQRYEAFLSSFETEDDGKHEYRMYRASLAWMNAALEAAATKERRIAALEAHRDRIRPMLTKVNALNLGAARGGETEKLESTRYWVLQVELWIVEAKK